MNYTSNSAGSSGSAGASGASNQTTFQIMPLPVGGLTEYTIVVDGQQLRYRMGTQAWTTFVWPNPSSQPGASIRAKNYDGQDFTIFEEAGSFGVERLINSARRTELGNDIFEMAWSGEGITIPVRFRIISGSASTASQGRSSNPFTGMKLPTEVIALGVTRTAAPATNAAQPDNVNPSSDVTAQNNTANNAQAGSNPTQNSTSTANPLMRPATTDSSNTQNNNQSSSQNSILTNPSSVTPQAQESSQ